MLTPRPWQSEGARFLASRKTAGLFDDPRVGKEQPVWSLVMTPSGPRFIGKLQPGDEVYSPDGSVTHVEAVFPQGVKQAYCVELTDGSRAECGIDHLWQVRDSNFERSSW